MNSIDAARAAQRHKQQASKAEREVARLWHRRNAAWSRNAPQLVGILSKLVAGAERLRDFHTERADALTKMAGNVTPMARRTQRTPTRRQYR